MHVDLDGSDPFPGVMETDICVVGSGVAGIALSRRLLSLGRTVTLLESGGLDYENGTADLNDGFNTGEDYYDLKDARLRLFGGTTAIWGGRVSELDPVDFERRPWVPYSGWPMSYRDLKPYYEQARALFGLKAREFCLEEVRAAGIAIPPLEGEELSLGLWHFDQRFDRFCFPNQQDLHGHPRCTVVTHATVTGIKTDEGARTVLGLVARSIGGRTLRVRARHYVLATGGIENARLLLANRDALPFGLGNAHDQVGRYFMEHPHARGGRILSLHSWQLLKAFGKTHRIGDDRIAALIKPSPELQRAEQILNSSLTIVGRQPEGARQSVGMRTYGHFKHKLAPDRRGRSLWQTVKRAARHAQDVADPFRPWLLHRLGLLEVALLVRAEQAPNPHSRVRLSRECDALGVPRVELDWRISRIDVESVSALVGALGRRLERLGLGQVEPASWLEDEGAGWRTDPLISAHPIGGYHHMGTTRMSNDPKSGVVDAYGRIHGVDNLHIAGSSVFPTSSWANPTLTIAALSIRTAERIARENWRAVPRIVRANEPRRRVAG